MAPLDGESSLNMDEVSVEMVRYSYMVQGKYGIPRRQGRPGNSRDKKGYSDHFPIWVRVENTP